MNRYHRQLTATIFASRNETDREEEQEGKKGSAAHSRVAVRHDASSQNLNIQL